MQYGRKLDMKGDFTIEDAAGVLRKFLNELPEPVVPIDFYLRVRQLPYLGCLTLSSDMETHSSLRWRI
jgi:hypothetical protein